MLSFRRIHSTLQAHKQELSILNSKVQELYSKKASITEELQAKKDEMERIQVFIA